MIPKYLTLFILSLYVIESISIARNVATNTEGELSFIYFKKFLY